MKQNFKKALVIFAAVAIGLSLRNHFFASETVAEPASQAPASQVDHKSEQQPTNTASKTATHQEVKLSGPTMGTSYHISYYADEVGGLTSEQVQSKIDSFLVDFNKEFSTYDPSSVISQYNQFNKANELFPISPRYANIVEVSGQIYQQTKGYLDITVYPLVKEWGFGPGKAKANISQEEIQSILQHVGFDKFALVKNADGQGGFALKKFDPQVQMDLSSIAKGLGIDQVGELLASLGAKNYIVEIGGEVITAGKFGDRDWSIAIEQPTYDGTTTSNLIIFPQGKAVATSGDYRNFRFENGIRITHEIDPFTGFPIRHNTASITVVADNCMLADGLATGLYVMGADQALEIAERDNLAIYVIEFKGGKWTSRSSSAFAKIKQEKLN